MTMIMSLSQSLSIPGVSKWLRGSIRRRRNEEEMEIQDKCQMFPSVMLLAASYPCCIMKFFSVEEKNYSIIM